MSLSFKMFTGEVMGKNHSIYIHIDLAVLQIETTQSPMSLNLFANLLVQFHAPRAPLHSKEKELFDWRRVSPDQYAFMY
jgi:hypothetical protein